MEDGKEEKRAKGVKGCVVKQELAFGDYYDCLMNPDEYSENNIIKMNGLRSLRHIIYSETVSKIGLSAGDDKRVIRKDKIHTLAHRHYILKYLDNRWTP
jgi:hypothetical protein